MERRHFLRSVAAVGGVGLGGCLGSAGSDSPVVLEKPDRDFDASELPYLTWKERVPDVTLPAPLEDRTVAFREVGKPMLLTYFYSHCQTVCPALISTMRNVQTHALNNGYGDAVAFFPITFDPARDDARRLDEYAEQMNVDADAGNWHFLRSESEARAEAVVTETFGVAFSKKETDGKGYMFVHSPMTTLVNGDGYVERAYRTKSPKSETIIEHLERVRNA